MRIVIALVCLFLAGCGVRPEFVFDSAARGIGAEQVVFAATNRVPVDTRMRFGGERSEQEAYRRYRLSIPPERAPGELVYPPRNGRPDPTRQFVTLSEEVFSDRTDFRRALAATLAATPRGQRDVVVFVHGYNTTFPESVYRIAQLAHDLALPGTVMLFSWPSAGKALGYVYDRDSAIGARDRLESVLEQVAAAGADRILLLAHSMGSYLTMETLRQGRHKRSPFMARIAGVILLSPDVDVDVFRDQAKAVGRLPAPILVFTSTRDRALSLSSFVAREPNRLGNLTDLERLKDLDVVLLDVSAFSTGLGHLDAGSSPTLIALITGTEQINGILSDDERSRVGLLPGVMITLQNATRLVVSPVVDLINQMDY